MDPTEPAEAASAAATTTAIAATSIAGRSKATASHVERAGVELPTDESLVGAPDLFLRVGVCFGRTCIDANRLEVFIAR